MFFSNCLHAFGKYEAVWFVLIIFGDALSYAKLLLILHKLRLSNQTFTPDHLTHSEFLNHKIVHMSDPMGIYLSL